MGETTPNAKLLADERIPRIHIDGVEWPIPKLSMEQIEIVVPVIMQNMHMLATPSKLTKETMREFGTAIFLALRRGHPSLTRVEFDEFAIGLFDIIEILPIVAKQSGCLRKPAPGENVPTGEALPTSPTGTS